MKNIERLLRLYRTHNEPAYLAEANILYAEFTRKQLNRKLTEKRRKRRRRG